MTKKVLFIFIVAVLGGFLIYSQDPLKDVTTFIIAGVVPGTGISLSVWQTFILMALFLLIARRALSNIHFQMIRHGALQTNAEKTKHRAETKPSVIEPLSSVASAELKSSVKAL